MISAFDFKERSRLLNARKEAKGRGVVLKAITTSFNERNRRMFAHYLENTDVRHYKKSNLEGMTLTIKDREEAGIVITSPLDENNIAIKISSPTFSKAMAEYFYFLWENSDRLPR